MLEGVTDLVGGATDFLGDKLNSVLQDILYATVYKLLYYLDVALCWIVGLLYKMFEVFAGVSEISYQDGPLTRKDYLINYFFQHESIKNVYWDMAMIGIVLCFFFTIISVIRKAGDLDGKQQKAYGQILRGTLKSVILILLMTAIITAVITATNTLMSAITTSFNRSDDADRLDSITYTEDQYAAMARVLNTIGNYSLSTSSTSRYNINSCYNEVRPDLLWLKEQGVFDFYYLDVDANGNPIESWQSALQKLVNAADLRFDLTMDVYNASVAAAITDIMNTINTDASFRPWSSYERKDIVDTTKTPMDVIMFLMGTSEAANNEEFNEDPSLTDNLRGAYYAKDKSIYDVDTVSEDFDIAVGKLDHIIIIVGAIKIIFDLATCILNAVARLFNILLLYLVSPLAISVSPMDDGGKFKQWTTAFVIQCFGILGIVISMRLLMLYMPIISNSNLQLFDDPVLNLLGKLILLLGGTEAAKRANGLITGILADNAGWQSIQAGDMSSVAQSAVSGVAGFGAGVLGGVAGVAADVTGVTSAKQRMSDAYKRFTERGGVVGSAANLASPSWGQTSEERSAERQHEYSQRMGWGGDGGGGSGGSSGGGDGGSGGSSGGSSGGGDGGSSGGSSGGDVSSQSNQNDSGEYDAKFESSNHDDEVSGGSSGGGDSVGGQVNNNGGDTPSDNAPSSNESNVNPLTQSRIKDSEGKSSTSSPGEQKNVGSTQSQSQPSQKNNSVPSGNTGSNKTSSGSQPAGSQKSMPAFTQSQFQSKFGAPKSNSGTTAKEKVYNPQALFGVGKDYKPGSGKGGSPASTAPQQQNQNVSQPAQNSGGNPGAKTEGTKNWQDIFGLGRNNVSGSGKGGSVGGTNHNKK